MAKKTSQTNPKGKEVEENAPDELNTEKKTEDSAKKRELNPDKIGDLIKLFQTTKSLDDLKPAFYKHILRISERFFHDDEYHILFLYEPYESIHERMVDRIYNAIPDDNEKPILLVIYNHGGRIEPAYLISKTCKELSSKFIVTIPRKAKSAATLIALGGNEIHMGPMSELGPIDPQFGGLPALGISSSLRSIAKVVCEYPDSSIMFAEYLKEKLDLRILGYFERVSESAQQYASRLLTSNENLPVEPDKIAHKLVYEYKDHSFVIDKEEATALLGATIKMNTNEYRFSNAIHTFLINVNLLLGVFHDKTLSIIGSSRDFTISDKQKNDDQ